MLMFQPFIYNIFRHWIVWALWMKLLMILSKLASLVHLHNTLYSVHVVCFSFSFHLQLQV